MSCSRIAQFIIYIHTSLANLRGNCAVSYLFKKWMAYIFSLFTPSCNSLASTLLLAIATF